MNTLKIDNDILINTCSNFEKDSKDIFFTTDINFIQFHFCLEGKISLKYNNGAYTFNLQENNSIFYLTLQLIYLSMVHWVKKPNMLVC